MKTTLKTTLAIISAGMLHLIPAICIIVISTKPQEAVVALMVSCLFFATLALGYWHGREGTWVKKTQPSHTATFPN